MPIIGRVAFAVSILVLTGRIALGASLWQGKDAAISLSYDDGYPSQYTIAAPLLASKGIKATFYVIGSWLNDTNIAAWQAALKNGHEIGNHTWSHPCAPSSPERPFSNSNERLQADQMFHELSDTEEIIRANFENPHSFAYPCGDQSFGLPSDASDEQKFDKMHLFDDLIYGVTTISRTVESGVNDIRDVCQSNPTVLKTFAFDKALGIEALETHIDAAIKDGTWIIISFHEIRDDTQNPLAITIKDHESLVSYVESKMKENNIWVDTVYNIGTYYRYNPGRGLCENVIPLALASLAQLCHG
jgi:peptidoglycan/xylan/chitin deacetylase (PgdA/CDA1 family)